MLPKVHYDFTDVADVWPSTSAFDWFQFALSPLHLKLVKRLSGSPAILSMEAPRQYCILLGRLCRRGKLVIFHFENGKHQKKKAKEAKKLGIMKKPKALEAHRQQAIEEQDAKKVAQKERVLELPKKNRSMLFSEKIKKFIKAHSRHLRLQEELKRSQAHLKKLGEQLGSDAVGPSANEDDLNINSISDRETADEPQADASSRKKRTRLHLEPHDISNRENSTKGDKLEKLSRFHVLHLQSSNSKEPKAYGDANNGHKPLAFGEKPRKGVNVPSDTSLPDKSKVSESGLPLPPTGMAAHVVEEDVKVVEMEEKAHVVIVAAAGAVPEVTFKILTLPFLLPPLPLIPQNVYVQHLNSTSRSCHVMAIILVRLAVKMMQGSDD
ncbi:unnamed protein product [Fraxinus pennsylvanica]|uniref:Uncharacterized protein n=1 Tax=Fraxinus pennsylvanica TaxID=56036 RepID=A0AAD1ZMW7_9LAMI|nr:unnamed protein product [Fraxinus pennsylvanica]